MGLGLICISVSRSFARSSVKSSIDGARSRIDRGAINRQQRVQMIERRVAATGQRRRRPDGCRRTSRLRSAPAPPALPTVLAISAGTSRWQRVGRLLHSKTCDRLRLAVVEKLKVLFLQSADGASLAVAHDHAYYHQVHAHFEGGVVVLAGRDLGGILVFSGGSSRRTL